MRPTINVIDCYHGNAVKNSDFVTMKNGGLYGVIHKASQGSHYVDPAYAARKVAAQAAGLLWGAYHFLDASDPNAQATAFLEASGITANTDQFFLACDFESWPASQATLKQCMTFMAAVDRGSPPGVQCALYSGNVIRETLKPAPAGHNDPDMAGVTQFFQNHRLWLAEYGPTENIPYPWHMPIVKSSDGSNPLPAPDVFLWQFTEKGHLSPLAGFTDGNFFDGTLDQLTQRWLA